VYLFDGNICYQFFSSIVENKKVTSENENTADFDVKPNTTVISFNDIVD
jgi:hypothetical protein